MEKEGALTNNRTPGPVPEPSRQQDAGSAATSIMSRTVLGAVLGLGVAVVLWADSMRLEERLPAGLQVVPGLTALLHYGLLTALVAAALAGLALNDYWSLSRRLGADFSRPLLIACGMALLLLQWAGWAATYGLFYVCPVWLRQPGTTAIAVLCGAAFVLLADRVLRGRIEGSFQDVSLFVLGLLYVAVAFGFIGALRVRWGVPGALTAVAVCKSTDIGGYYFGHLIGGPRLAHRVSPRKTWAGAAGAAVAAVLMALALTTLGWTILSIPLALLYGLLMAPVAVLGDLSESLLKRQAGVKDSGNLVPGYGGMLDILDDLLFALPFSYLFFAVVYHYT